MNLTNEEIFALNMLFRDKSIFSESILSQQDRVKVLERQGTGVGYFTKIEFPEPLPKCIDKKILDWNFNHVNLKYGGSFIVYYSPPNLIELEAVVHDGLWPNNFDKNSFSDA